MGKNLPTGIVSRVSPVTGRKQYRARLQDKSALTPMGKPRQASSRWFDGLADAKGWLEDKRHQKRTVGTISVDRSINVGEACDAWLKVAREIGVDGRNAIQETTAEHYEGLIKRYIKPTMGQIAIADLTKPMVSIWRDALAMDKSKSIARRSLGALKMVLEYYSGIGAIPINPSAGVKMAAGKDAPMPAPADGDDLDAKPVEQYMSPEIVRHMLDTLDMVAETGSMAADKAGRGMGDHQRRQRRQAYAKYRALIYVLIASGIRIGEACALQWRHVLWDERAISVEQAYKRTSKGKPKIGLPKSAASTRHVTLDNATMAILRALYEAVPDRKARSYVFASDKPISPLNFANRCWNLMMVECGFVDKAGNRHWSLHDCRHYHASLLIGERRDIQQVADRLGHANTVVTQTVYQHLFKSRKGLNNRLDEGLAAKLFGR